MPTVDFTDDELRALMQVLPAHPQTLYGATLDAYKRAALKVMRASDARPRKIAGIIRWDRRTSKHDICPYCGEHGLEDFETTRFCSRCQHSFAKPDGSPEQAVSVFFKKDDE